MSELERILNAKEKKNKDSFLSKILKRFKNFLRLSFPKIYKIKLYLKKKQTFSGWGLSTDSTCPPWHNLDEQNNIIFNQIQNDLIKKVEEKDFHLTQFNYRDANYKKVLEELLWRHYVVFNSVLYAIKFTKEVQKNIVECGVCDGLTMNFAMSACLSKKITYTGFLYDAWEELLSNNEKLRFNYSYLDINTTKINLKNFSNNSIYNKGFIPKVFKDSKNPQIVHWLHVDLNSTEATIESLNFFYDKIVNHGVILFDDYGGFDETRKAIDIFFSNKNGHFTNLPTGQGIFYKNN